MKTRIFILLCLFPIIAFSQNKKTEELLRKISEHQKEDTEKVDLMLQLSAGYFGADTKKLSETAKEAYNLSNKINYKKGMAESLKLQGAANISLGDYKTAESYFNESLKIYQNINYNPGIVICYSNLGSVKLYQNLYPDALKLYQTSIRYAEKSGDFKNSALAYGNMGIIYSELKNYNQALTQFNQALQNHIKANNANGIASSYSNIGTVYFNQENFPEAYRYYNLALEKNKEIGNQLGIAREYGNIASFYMKENNYAKAFENINSALKINQELKNKKGIALNYQGLGEFYLNGKQPEKALESFQKALKIADEIGTKDIQKNTYQSLSELYGQKKNADSAYYYYKKYIDIKETFDNENNRKQISRLEVQYEFDSKEEKYKNQQILDAERLKKNQLQLQQNQLLLNINNLKLSESNKARDLVHLDYLKTQAELKNEQLESNTQQKQLEISKKEILLKQNEIKVNKLQLAAKEKQKWFYIIGIGLLSVIGIMLFYQSRNRQKNNEKLSLLNSELDKANKNKIRFFGILNHDLRSPVASLVHFLHLQKDAPDLLDEETQNRLNRQTTTSAERLLQQMEDLLLWSKSQMEKFEAQKKQFSVKELFSELQNEFVWVENTEIIFEDFSEIKIFSDKEYLKTILRNLIGNAVKVLGNKPEAKILCSAENISNSVKISVKDNGGGTEIEKFKALYSDSESIGIKQGLGLHVIRDLCKAVDAEIEVKTNKEIGETEIILFLKKLNR